MKLARGRTGLATRAPNHGLNARQQLASGQSPDAVLEFLAHTLTNRLLHPPTAALREAAASGDAALLDAVTRMLPPDDPAPTARDDDDAADAAP